MTPDVLYLRRRNARRYILRVDDEGMVRVTIPRGGSLEYARKFAERHAEWIAGQVRKRHEQAQERSSEKSVMFRGENLPLVIEGNGVSFGDHKIFVAEGEDLRLRIRAKLFELAKAEFPGRVMELAVQFGLQVKRVSVRDQRSRWGSCSTRGNIALNYRLVQTPEFVRDYVIVHELMHLKEMNHSNRFWKLVHEAFPRTEEARNWLRANGKLERAG
jgi:predicted metal-dependent hydrolase